MSRRRNAPKPGERAARRRGLEQVKRLEEFLKAGHEPERALRLAGVDRETAEQVLPKLKKHLRRRKEAGDDVEACKIESELGKNEKEGDE